MFRSASSAYSTMAASIRAACRATGCPSGSSTKHASGSRIVVAPRTLARSMHSRYSSPHLRKFLNKILRPTGYRIERLSRFRTEIEALLRGSTLKFVQIGANDGVRFDDLYQVVTNAQCSGIVVEPLPDMYQR